MGMLKGLVSECGTYVYKHVPFWGRAGKISYIKTERGEVTNVMASGAIADRIIPGKQMEIAHMRWLGLLGLRKSIIAIKDEDGRIHRAEPFLWELFMLLFVGVFALGGINWFFTDVQNNPNLVTYVLPAWFILILVDRYRILATYRWA